MPQYQSDVASSNVPDTPQFKYRPDIDGLRAFAILPVVLFHSGLTLFSGGYVGVDIFFVISGYVITCSLQGRSGDEPFSLRHFYHRRVRRLFPALLIVLAVSTAACCIILLPDALRSYGTSLAAVALSLSNIAFYRETGYFDTLSAEKPLLHTWSLSVEEQFYIFWPSLFHFLLRPARRRYLVPATLSLIAISFAFSVWLSYYNQAGSFYLPHSRAWELLLGALLAIVSPPDSRTLRNLLSVAGFAMIMAAIFLYQADTRFPGLAAALPVVGTALQIHANRLGDTFGAKLLSWRPLVYIGLLSYSFYLWHWPVLSLAHYYLAETPSLRLSLILITMAFALAALSYHGVERPLRKGRQDRRSQNRVLLTGVVAMLVVMAVGLGLRAANGLPQRMPDTIVRLQDYTRDFDKSEVNCDLARPGAPTVRPACAFGQPGDGYDVLLWGDSHAEAIANAVHIATEERKLHGAQLTLEACAPLIGVTEVGGDSGFGASCADFNRRVLTFIAAHPELKTVVVAGRWALRTETTRFGSEPGNRRFMVQAPGDPHDVTTSRRAFTAGLQRLIREIREVGGPDLRIVLVGQAPEMGFDVPQCVARAKYFGRGAAECKGIPADIGHRRVAFARSALQDEGAADPKITLLPLDDLVCDSETCHAVRGATPVYRDFQHLSDTGSAMFASALSRLLVEPATAGR